LRNNGSTMVSQLVDTVAVTLITWWTAWQAGKIGGDRIIGFIVGGYSYKLIIAVLDTIPFYVGVIYLGRWLRIDPTREHEADREEAPSS